jgi:sortase, SrtB family
MNNKSTHDRQKKDGVSTAEAIGVRIIRFISVVVDYIIMLLLLLILVYSTYSVTDTRQIYTQASYTQYEQYKPIAAEDTLSFEALMDINDEVFAWLTVYGTRIDYPVAHSAEDNNKYVNTDITGQYSLAGSIYLASRNSRDFSDFNSIIYGHHMDEGAMFGDLDKFKEEDFFQSRRYGNLYFAEKDHGIEFFAYLSADAYDWNIYNPGIKGSDEDKRAYIMYLLDIATYTRDIDVTAEDKIILLSTCASERTNGRDILVGKLSDEVFLDSFEEEQKEDGGVWRMVDSQGIREWAGELTSWGWVTVLLTVILILIVLILIESLYSKKKIKRRKRDEK